jgi:hypothetical protein
MEGLWQSVLYKYLANDTLSGVKVKPSDSSFWRGIMKVRDLFSRFALEK